MIRWGISGSSHDAALAVFQGPALVWASHSERFTAKKNDPDLCPEIIAAALEWGEPQEIHWYEDPRRKTLRQLWAGQGWLWRENTLDLGRWGLRQPLIWGQHHQSHAAAGYYTSPFDTAAVVCIDGIGEWTTLSVWSAEGTELTEVYSQGYPHSLGLWYSAITQRLGLKPLEDEYVVMGMAAWGDPERFRDSISEMIQLGERPWVRLRDNLHRGCPDLLAEHRDQQSHWDIAAAAQTVYERALDHVLARARELTGRENLVLMGGCALNCRANSLAYKHFDRVWIMPSPGDAGSAIGTVLARTKTHIQWRSAMLGRDMGRWPQAQVLAALKRDQIVGVAAGRAEFGPRALGNRSLLADPRGRDIKERVNTIKRRQQFRPFAPAILREHYDRYFAGPANEYMQFTSRVRDPGSYPAITHRDGTARVQLVDEQTSPGLYHLLQAWYRDTGCPMLLNTSLNIRGEPMIDTPEQAEKFQELYGVRVHTGLEP
jgi:carbamoyltransferase